MSYIGKVELKASDIKRDSGTISGTPSTVTLNFTAANANSLLFYLNGVKQSTSLYTISGSPTVITLASGTFTAADEWEAIGINDIGTAIVPADGSVTLPKISAGTGSAGQFLKTDDSILKHPKHTEADHFSISDRVGELLAIHVQTIFFGAASSYASVTTP